MALPDQIYLILDYETRSEAEIGTVGAYEYAKHPSTEIICAAWCVGTRDTIGKAEIRTWAPIAGRLLGDPKEEARGKELNRLLLNPRVMVEAHNAFFERVITEFCLGIKIPIERLSCTAALAASYGFPRNLAGACDALNLPVRKDPKGKLLIRRHCIPRKVTAKNSSKWNNDPEGLAELLDYCATDVKAERGLFLKLKPLPTFERKVWMLDQAMNYRGVRVDRESVLATQKLIQKEIENLTHQVREVTEGKVTEATKRAKALSWLKSEGVELPNLQKKTVEDWIKSQKAESPALKFLKLRQSISRTSTAKYWSFEERTRTDGRLRDFQLYSGAGTGRFVCTGVQLHNFPRGVAKDMSLEIEALKTGNPEWVRSVFGDPMEVASNCLRGMVTADLGKTLYAADYAGIEARVNFWLAGHSEGLELFSEGRDPYREEATGIYGVELHEVTADQREVGKRAFLGLGFEMGFAKFMETCEAFGSPIDEDTARRAVTSYRSNHRPVSLQWRIFERSAIWAVKHPGKVITMNRVSWKLDGKFLFCRLPSGRKLTYYAPAIKYERRSKLDENGKRVEWGDREPRLYYWDTHPKIRNRWVFQPTYGGKLCENLCQSVARELMVSAMLRAEERGFRVMLTVHDEIVVQHQDAGRLSEFEKIMAKNPEWAAGLPTKVKGFESFRYRKG